HVATIESGQIRVEQDITHLAVGLEVLREDIDVVLQEHLVQSPEHSRHVAVNMTKSRAVLTLLQLHLRKIYGARRRTASEVIEHLSRHFCADPVLRLFRRTADVRGQDYVRQALQGTLKA